MTIKVDSELEVLLGKINDLAGGNFIEGDIANYCNKIENLAKILSFKDEGQLVGFIAYYANDINKKNAFLTMLVIDPAFTGNGYGEFLLNMSIVDLKKHGFKNYTLEVQENNFSAIHLYKKQGFQLQKSYVTTNGYLKFELDLTND